MARRSKKQENVVEEAKVESVQPSEEKVVQETQKADPPAEKAKPAAKKKSVSTPKFEPKEVLLLEGKKCIFVEKLKGKVVVRFLEGGYSSAEESKFTLP